MEVDKGDVFSSPVWTLLAVARSRNVWPRAEHRTDAGEGMSCNYTRELPVKTQIYSPFFFFQLEVASGDDMQSLLW